MEITESISNTIITKPDENGDGLCVKPDPNGYAIKINDCKVDFYGTKPSVLDENLSFVNGVSAIISNSVFTNGIKLVLCGNGDYPIADRKMFVQFNNCVFKDFGRRGPEAQDGATVILNNCVIWNWGIQEWFDVRSFAGWAHSGASITMNNCVLIQERFNQSGWKNMLVDIANHIGNDFNEGSLSWKSLIPGTMRGLYSSTKGFAEFNDSYKPRWVYVQGAKLFSSGDKHKARQVIRQTFKKCGLQQFTTRAISAL